MPKQITRAEYPDVKESFLYKQLDAFLKALNGINTKFPLKSKSAKLSIEEMHARKLLNGLIELIGNFTGILTYFDKGKIPGSTDILKVLSTLNAFKEKRILFRTKESLLFTAVKKLLPDIINSAIKEILKNIQNTLNRSHLYLSTMILLNYYN